VNKALQPGAPEGCAGLVEQEATAMGTRTRVAICPGKASPADVRSAIDAAMKEFLRLEALWTTWSKDSDISKINANAGKAPIAVSPETFEVLERANAGSALSNGLFDVTFAPLGELWKFERPPESHLPVKLERVPTAAEVSTRRALVDWHKLRLEPKGRTVLLEKEGMSVHLGGIGKGAAVDRVTSLLRARGFKDFTVQAGGDLFCAGKNGERPWRIGIAHPREKGRIVGSLDVSDAAFSTSGDYERFTIIEGVRYHHIIDPRTGYPASASQSATVLAPSATDAEILTKTAFILGEEEGLVALGKANAKGVIINAEGQLSVSPGLPLEKP
jgi:thiamine biosynthesis lipoprotein